MKKHNFGAGPCILPNEVFDDAAKAVLDFNGLSILEVSHRSKDFENVMQEARDLVKKALNISDDYEVVYLQGGATLGFTIAALNMMRDTKKAAYVNTGTWASGAIKEAKKVGVDVNVIASSETENFNYIPKNSIVPTDVDYFHFTSNNTIYGTQFKEMPQASVPVVCDMSSDIFSKEIDASKYDLIYAGAQKNLGPAGATLYIVKKDALGKSTSTFMPSY
ncbi:MAG: 3-phosphoserine/phosphohydroxythreonine transaminase, partial [Fluviicola sp.]